MTQHEQIGAQMNDSDRVKAAELLANMPEVGLDAIGRRLRELAERAEALRYEVNDFDENDGFVHGLRMLDDIFHFPKDGPVVYPGSDKDIRVAGVFGKDRVTHVDPNEDACEALARNGYKAQCQGIEDYHTNEKAGVMIAYNSYGAPTHQVLEGVMQPGGYIVANNYTEWANRLQTIDGVSLVGAAMPAGDESGYRVIAAKSIPADAMDVEKKYIKLNEVGTISTGTPADHDMIHRRPHNPDALFVFRFEPDTVDADA